MAKLRSGILGTVRGKVSGVVGSQWKDVNYVREYIKPANPNTSAQQVQRGLMGNAVAFAKVIVGPVFNVYTDKFIRSMSGFNYFIKQNITEFVASPTYTNIVVTEGKLSSVSALAGVYDNGSGNISVTWSTNYGNNGLVDDAVFCIGYNKDTGIFYFVPDEAVRSSESDTLAAIPGLTAADITIWSITAQYVSGVLSLISHSDVATCSAA